MNLRLLLIPLTAAVLLSGCAKSVPSESEGAAALRDDVAIKGRGKIELVSFEKTNAHDLNVFGQIGYVLEFHAKLRTKEPVYLNPTRSTGLFGDAGYAVVDDPRGSLISRNTPPPPEQLIPTGTEFEVDGNVTYEKKEKGWAFSELESKRLPNPVIDVVVKGPPPKSY